MTEIKIMEVETKLFRYLVESQNHPMSKVAPLPMFINHMKINSAILKATQYWSLLLKFISKSLLFKN